MERGFGTNQDMCTWSVYRPRGALARALYNKHVSDHCLDNFDRREWYSVDEDKLSEMAKKLFLKMGTDEETEQFLEASTDLSNCIFTQIFHSVVKFILGFFMTQTSINGLLGRGSMFVFSGRQFSELTGRGLGDCGDLLDLGAGDGATTQIMASFFTDVYATEISDPMRKQLKARGFRVLEADNWCGKEKFDLVSCLNVLDRCEKPLGFLRDIRSVMGPSSKAVLALVLPYKPYVEIGRHRPDEVLPIEGVTFEEQVGSVIEILGEEGLRVEAWTRLPYLCQGDLHQAYYWLDDAVFLVSRYDKS